MGEEKKKKTKFCINDHQDLLIEILTRLDERSLGVAACVCRLWCSICRNDSLWENLCFRQVSPPTPDVRPVVAALGGYRRLYMVCLRPVLSRLSRLSLGTGANYSGGNGRVWTRDEVQLSLSLFSIDYYERLGARKDGDAHASASSLMFLCKPVNV
ncbi:PREDICTED: F-box protein SNE-like [Nelumbo nucifera]|uniref:F-box protein SNE-like n=2 Tax=Nelumbo nucifera TaxID=4432 RepID=A0A1U7ZMT1_NELNU|nr:PREDICTED: F-box protein SNE-like [Nelumbo nucifera]DAD23631.1 TPA_asm: hypothetical protein HUJ06_025094 [Nelumbo nucifera]